jgi:hypothetical protein
MERRTPLRPKAAAAVTSGGRVLSAKRTPSQARAVGAEDARGTPASARRTQPRSVDSASKPAGRATPGSRKATHARTSSRKENAVPDEKMSCMVCHGAITPDEPSAKLNVGSRSRFVHRACQKCAQCQVALLNKVYIKDDLLMCAEHGLNECAECKRKIEGRDMKWKHAHYHEECFRFIKCDRCEEPIAGARLKVAKLVLHPECLKCAVCEVKLDSTRVYTTPDNDDILCLTHRMAL